MFRGKQGTISLKMSVLGFFITLFLLSLSLLSLATEAHNRPTYLEHFCSNTTTFTRNSTYQTNLQRLLSSLSSNSSAAANGFYNTTFGENPNKVYGLFLCRGDVSTTVCRNCVTFATGNVTQLCPVEKEAVIWYDECLLRYSSEFIFSAVSEDPWVSFSDNQNVTDPTRFDEVLANSLNDATNQAVSLAKRFSTNEANVSRLQTLYSLVQCTPDLSSLDCNRCLREVIASLPGCCGGRVSGSVLNPSCNVRYAVYRFYNLTAVATPAPPQPVVTSSGSVIIPKGKGRKSWLIIVTTVVPVSVTILFFIVGYCLLTRRGRKKNDTVQEVRTDITTIKSLQYDLKSIEAATNKFADSNKLGQGGFGVVYKGSFLNGKEIAVKRLSKSSGQGAEEFKNEVVVLAKLQHRNLVKLLGFCTERKERMLIYEFVPNKSLDFFLFDPERSGELDWPRRHKIIKGIARGLLYLHTDSRVKIIHRDLKASNILLDEDMVPKISDFGMARIIEENRTQEPTKRIVGTYGYISPEFAMHGKFSEKSDVFSFGVLMLEIVCGKRSTGSYNPNHSESLLTHAWKHWKGGTALELMDPTLRDSYVSNEVARCIQIGLLCVQENPTARPTMARVVLMLSSSSVTLPAPQKNAFFFGSITGLSGGSVELERDRNTDKSTSCSVDDASITRLYPR